MKQKNNVIKLYYYPLTNSWQRILAKIIDFLIITSFIFSIGFLIFLPEIKNTSLIINNEKVQNQWRFALFSFIASLIFFIFLFLIPCYWKRTIGMKICKLKYIQCNKSTSNFVLCLFKHELFVWELIIVWSILFSILLSFYDPNNVWNFLKSFFQNNTKPSFLMIFFSSMYSFFSICVIIIIFSIFIKNKKPALHDVFSNLYIIHLTPINKYDTYHNNKNNKKKEHDYTLPGEIISSAFDEL